MWFDGDDDDDDKAQQNPNQDVPGDYHPPKDLPIPGESEGIDDSELG
jgi:hypothetical protein